MVTVPDPSDPSPRSEVARLGNELLLPLCLLLSYASAKSCQAERFEQVFRDAGPRVGVNKHVLTALARVVGPARANRLPTRKTHVHLRRGRGALWDSFVFFR